MESSEHTEPLSPESPPTESGSASGSASAGSAAPAAPPPADIEVTSPADVANGPVDVAAAPPVAPRAKTKGVADIVFLIDVSGSMTPIIDALRKNIETFIDS